MSGTASKLSNWGRATPGSDLFDGYAANSTACILKPSPLPAPCSYRKHTPARDSSNPPGHLSSFETANLYRSFTNGGVQRGKALLPEEGLGVWGYPPVLKSHNPSKKGGGYKGVEKRLINNLILCGLAKIYLIFARMRISRQWLPGYRLQWGPPRIARPGAAPHRQRRPPGPDSSPD